MNTNDIEIIEPFDKRGSYPLHEVRKIYEETGFIKVKRKDGATITVGEENAQNENSDWDKILENFSKWLAGEDV